MRFLQIDGQSLQISLGAPDMKDLGISFSEMDYTNTATRRALWSLLDRAKSEIGFDAAKGRIEVRAIAARGGGCELFIKKTHDHVGGDEVSYTRENIRCGTEKAEREECVSYKFDSSDALAGACRHIYSRGYSGRSSAYFDEDGGRYYLILYDSPKKPAHPQRLRALSFVSEFGAVCPAPCADAYIAEHFSCICDRDAVKIIAKNC